jgi:hypothetical protein
MRRLFLGLTIGAAALALVLVAAWACQDDGWPDWRLQ